MAGGQDAMMPTTTPARYPGALLTELLPFRKYFRMGQIVQINDRVDPLRGFGNYELWCWHRSGAQYRVKIDSNWGDRDICNHLRKTFIVGADVASGSLEDVFASVRFPSVP